MYVNLAGKSRDNKFFVSLDSTELSSESLSSNSTVQNSFEDQPKKLPSQNFPLSSNSRTQSLNDLSESTDLSRLKSCPPSFKNSKENLKNPMENSMEASEKTNENSQISFAFIDKTPSKDSLAIPYCPPMKIDYEDFTSLLKDSSEDWAILITEQALENHKSELVILPVEGSATEFNKPFPSPVIPLFTTNLHKENANVVPSDCQTLSTPAVYTSVQQIHIKSPNQGILFFILYFPYFMLETCAAIICHNDELSLT